MPDLTPLLVIPGLFGTQIDVKVFEISDWTKAFPVDNQDNADDLFYLKMDAVDDPSTYKSRANTIDVGYDELFEKLEEKGYSEADGTLVKVPFDWRYSLEKSVGTFENTTPVSEQYPIAYTIDQQAKKSPTGKVNILCHSMGCLATFYYIVTNNVNALESVDKIVFLAPPLWGTVESYKRIIGGYGPKSMEDYISNTQWKEIFQNMKGVYQIAPGQVLTQCLDNSFLSFIVENSTKTIVNEYNQDYQQSYAENGDEDMIEQLDNIINCDLLREIGQWRITVDDDITSNEVVKAIMNQKGYLFWGLIENSTPAHICCNYSEPNAAPVTSETLSLGDENVLYKDADQLPAAGQKTFLGLTHMDMVKNSTVIDDAVDILQGVQ